MSETSTDHTLGPRTAGLLFAVALLLAQAGNAAAQLGTVCAGP